MKNMNKAIDIIEPAHSYYLLSKDHRDTKTHPVFVGGRIKLEYALEGINADMVIATSGNNKRCVILMDYSDNEVWLMAQKGNKGLMKLKAKN